MYHMIDVGNKPISLRIALAQGTIIVGKHAFNLIKNKQLPKGDPLIIAEIAGINAAKQACIAIPLCHALALSHVKIIHEFNEQEFSITVYCTATAHAKTGVEMEALAGVNGALLTIYDLTKMVEPNLTITNIKLLAKQGGKTGLWFNQDGVPNWVFTLFQGSNQETKDREQNISTKLTNYTCAVITLSDRASASIYPDLSGPLICSLLEEQGVIITEKCILPDNSELLKQKIILFTQQKINLIITTGGTGVSPSDITPETLNAICDKLIPGIGELLRINGAQFTHNSWSSRSLAGIIDHTLIIALPGKPQAIKESIPCLLPLLPHILATIADIKHD